MSIIGSDLLKPTALSVTESMWLKTGSKADKQLRVISFFDLKRSLEDFMLDRYGLYPSDFKSSSRTAEISINRSAIMYCLRDNTDVSLELIGSTYNRNHATVINSCKVIQNLIDTDLSFAVKYNDMLIACGLTSESERFRAKYIDIEPEESDLPRNRINRRVIYDKDTNTYYDSHEEAAVACNVLAETISRHTNNRVMKVRWEYRYKKFEIK